VEQKEVLESIYRQGIYLPTWDEIGRITKQLQAYGEVEEENVFYWFHNTLMDEMLTDPYVPRTQVSTDSKFFLLIFFKNIININILTGFTLFSVYR
jgi:hypothetical protein